eukprot:CAMPEP_0116567632 /NCGR_PEP_ID=MMETSP0397-20121206/15121_1 /TAXON_ID=216820 /ORGANISM="Cyclophora tenuis, Strain ECT3854" /LENGTH=325 /DNA_ID=CAMNT_0004094657 /DNA_START=36 /DNA_END=1013 /DNA_ORIENTATION=+
MGNANLSAVVEPFFLNPDLCKNVPESFEALVKSLKDKGVTTAKSVEDLEEFNAPTMCLIAGRTMDNPKFFRQCVAKGAKIIYLEKPGAPSVKELEEMASLAEEKGVKVYIGYNKNVTPYVQKALAVANKNAGSQVLFCHNNSYTTEALPECFGRNSEGMLKNMAVHELALLVSFFNVTVETIDKFEIDGEFSEKLTLDFNSKSYIDFSRIRFTVTTKSGATVSVMADRCGGNVSYALVQDKEGNDIEKFEFPDAETAAKVEEQVQADPEMMPYFFVQSDDYLELKNRVINATLAGKEPEGVATINVGVEALKLAEYGTAQLNESL